jgi:hypothetical protein
VSRDPHAKWEALVGSARHEHSNSNSSSNNNRNNNNNLSPTKPAKVKRSSPLPDPLGLVGKMELAAIALTLRMTPITAIRDVSAMVGMVKETMLALVVALMMMVVV